MLRRIKKDVENELSDKIEIMMYCPLTSRQKMLYAGEFYFPVVRQLFEYVLFYYSMRLLFLFLFSALRKKIRIEDLLHSSGAYQSQTITSNLMNLVMQFRKVSARC